MGKTPKNGEKDEDKENKNKKRGFSRTEKSP